MNDSDDGITITSATGSRTITPEQVEAEARRIAMRTGGILRMAMAEKGLSDETLAARLEAEPEDVCAQMLGEAWESYLPLAAMCLALGIKMDLQTTSN
jgi:ribosome-binding protein aMBF1 (putative translation factor)